MMKKVMMTMINSFWLLLAVARSISTVDKEEECYCLGPTAASLSASLALSLSLSPHLIHCSLISFLWRECMSECVCARGRSFSPF